MSSSYNPFVNWQCPHCLQNYTPPTNNDTNNNNNERVIFLRGSCNHDICYNCIAKQVNRRNLLKQSGSISTRRRNDANNHVICPLVECHNGKFLVDESTFMSKVNLKNEEVIDLCDDDDWLGKSNPI